MKCISGTGGSKTIWNVVSRREFSYIDTEHFLCKLYVSTTLVSQSRTISDFHATFDKHTYPVHGNPEYMQEALDFLKKIPGYYEDLYQTGYMGTYFPLQMTLEDYTHYTDGKEASTTSSGGDNTDNAGSTTDDTTCAGGTTIETMEEQDDGKHNGSSTQDRMDMDPPPSAGSNSGCTTTTEDDNMEIALPPDAESLDLDTDLGGEISAIDSAASEEPLELVGGTNSKDSQAV